MPAKRKEYLLELAGILLNLIPYVGGAIGAKVNNMSTDLRFSRLEGLIEGISKELEQANLPVLDEYLRSEEFKGIFRQILLDFLDEKNAGSEEFYRKLVAQVILSSGSKYEQVKADLDAIAASYQHQVIGRAHVLKHLLRHGSFVDKWLLPAQISQGELDQKLDGLLQQIRQISQGEERALSGSAQRIVKDAVHFSSTVPDSEMTDCLWVALRDHTAPFLQASATFLSPSDRSWTTFIRNVERFNALFLAGTPYVESKGER